MWIFPFILLHLGKNPTDFVEKTHFSARLGFECKFMKIFPVFLTELEGALSKLKKLN